jgi:hypothetical protein
MILTDVVKIPVLASLGVVAAILAVSIVASLLRPGQGEEDTGTPTVPKVQETEAA